MKIPKMLFVWIAFGWLSFLGFLLPTTRMTWENVTYCGFSMDQSGNLYVAKGSIIEVVTQSGESVRVIDLHGVVGYTEFTIVDDIIYLHAAEQLLMMDVEGNVLNSIDNYYDLDYSETLKFSPRKYISPDGITYVLRNPFFRSTIYRLDDGGRSKVYQMPAGEYAARLLLIVFYASSFLFFGPYIIWKWYKLNPELLKKLRKKNPNYRPQWTMIEETSQTKDPGAGLSDDPTVISKYSHTGKYGSEAKHEKRR